MKCPSCGFDNLPGEDNCTECSADLRDQDIPTAREGIQKSILEDTIEKLCTHRPNSVSANTSLREVLAIMRDKKIASVVIGDEAPFEGIFTERDFLYKVAGKNVDLDATMVGDLMTTNPSTVPYDQPIAAAINQMSSISVRHVPVVRDGKLAEILSVQDILIYLDKNLQGDRPSA